MLKFWHEVYTRPVKWPIMADAGFMELVMRYQGTLSHPDAVGNTGNSGVSAGKTQ